MNLSIRSCTLSVGATLHAWQAALPRMLLPLLIASGLCMAAGAASTRADAQGDYEAGVAAHARDDLMGALDLLQKAADQGHVPAMVRLAYLLDKAEQNEAAFRLYARAAEAGNAEAALALSGMYASGEGTVQDQSKALDWMTRSAESGYGPAVVTLAQVYLRGGLGVTADREQAFRLLERAASLGYVPARQELARLRAEPAAARGKK